MKQAILITAYKNYAHLEEIIHFFDNRFEVFIHIDKKSTLSSIERNRLEEDQKVKLVTQKYRVHWGGFNHLLSILYLAERALKNRDIYYFHLISGHDFPIKRTDEIYDFFSKNRNKDFIDVFDVPFAGWGQNGGLDRVNYFHFYDFWNAKDPKQQRFLHRGLELQKKLGLQRSFSSRLPKIHGGSTWWSLSRDSLQYILTYSREKKELLNRFKHTFCCEEFYFQTVIMDSPYEDRVQKNNLRHIDWVARNGNNPAILDESDFNKLTQTEAFFARKFEHSTSHSLLIKIKTHLDSP